MLLVNSGGLGAVGGARCAAGREAGREWRFRAIGDVLKDPFRTLNVLKGSFEAWPMSQKRPSRATHPAGARPAPAQRAPPAETQRTAPANPQTTGGSRFN